VTISVLKAIYFAIRTCEEAAAHKLSELVGKGGIIREGQRNDRRVNARRGWISKQQKTSPRVAKNQKVTNACIYSERPETARSRNRPP
jgi:hypothetical protein